MEFPSWEILKRLHVRKKCFPVNKEKKFKTCNNIYLSSCIFSLELTIEEMFVLTQTSFSQKNKLLSPFRTGIEPMTFSLPVRRSNPLNYIIS